MWEPSGVGLWGCLPAYRRPHYTLRYWWDPKGLERRFPAFADHCKSLDTSPQEAVEAIEGG